MKIYLEREYLSDLSVVYNVRIDDTVIFHAITYSDADALIEKIRDAVSQHTCDTLDRAPKPA